MKTGYVESGVLESGVLESGVYRGVYRTVTKLAYLECPTGIAGDMCLGALIDLGVPLDYLIVGLGKLGIGEEYHLWAESVQRNGQRATKVHVDLRPIADEVSPAATLYESTHFSQDQAAEPHSRDRVAHAHAHSSHHSHPGDHHSHHTHSTHHSHDDDLPSPPRDTHAHATAHATAGCRIDEMAGADPHDGQTGHTHPGTRHLPEIEQMIQAAVLPPRATAWSLAVFRRLAEAEGAVHGIPPEQVHFHEVGATDAIADIVGTCLGLDWLNIDELHCSPLPTGGGTVYAAHGRLPVPAPAVLKLWEMRQIPIYSNGIDRELVTPTGAAIATTLATHFGPPPAMTLHQVGLGAGSINLPIPNILRLWLGESVSGKTQRQEHLAKSPALDSKPQAVAPESLPQSVDSVDSVDHIVLLETQIDDLNPQAIGYVFEALFAAGALDVFTQAIAMKKSRPGILLSVVCVPESLERCEGVMFRETTTLGIRRSRQQRQILHRELRSVSTDYGPIRVKVAWAANPQSPLNVQPEYEDCAAIARQHHLPWREVHRLALQSWYNHQP
jgi:pyridinium-3,5-bisthiocarboxylic acid mononucleotide nickel chelatase